MSEPSTELSPEEMLQAQVSIRHPGYLVVESAMVARITDGAEEQILLMSSAYMPSWSVYGLMQQGVQVAEKEWWGLGGFGDEDDDDEEG